MIKLFKILKKLFKNKYVIVDKEEINGYKEIIVNILNNNKYIIRLTINYKMQIICLEIIKGNKNEVVLTSFDKFFKKYICLYSFYIKAKNIFNTKNKDKIYNFLKEFGMSVSHTHFLRLMGYK